MKINNVYKTYDTNTGEKVQALKGVSFDLPSTGMVAILGKSGSGKSTLLNILSGLDSFDSGDIEAFGKNMRSFSQKELDHYRNSCVGFVFQEYHLIPELTVGDNIAVALQLQGQSGTEEKVKDALKLVELVGYENRKIDELSGGQKQRVAIARALVKNPKIIFADEPTGALDSQTGESILQILKAVSKEKLVILVTHDREFAQKYGDRIIELADGVVINDTDNTYRFTEAEKAMDMRKPRMPLKTALKIGCSNFKYHPIRLISTILLSVMAFLLLGVSLITSSVKFNDFIYDYLSSGNISSSILIKYDGEVQGSFSRDDVSSVKENFGGDIVAIKYKELTLDGYEDDISDLLPYMVVSISEDSLEYLNMKYEGQIPTSDNELAISVKLAEAICGIDSSITNKEACIGKSLTVCGNEYIITALIDTGEESEEGLPFQNALFAYAINSFDQDEYIALDTPAELHLTAGYPNSIFKIIENSDSIEKYTFNGKTDGNYLPVYLIPSVLHNVSCSIEYGGTFHRNYGQLFNALLSEAQDGTDIQHEYVALLDRLRNEFDLENSFSYSFKIPAYEFERTISIDGFYFEASVSENIPEDIILNDSLIGEIRYLTETGCDMLIVPVEPALKDYLDKEAVIRASDPAVTNLYGREANVVIFTKIASVLTIVFAAFSALLLVSFISQSLTDKTKTIGILRAFGSDSFNLIKIFVWEGLLLGGAVFLVSTTSLFGVCGILNALFSDFIGFNVHFFSMNVFTAIYMLLLAIAFSFIGCIIPIIKLIRLQPTEIIRSDI